MPPPPAHPHPPPTQHTSISLLTSAFSLLRKGFSHPLHAQDVWPTYDPSEPSAQAFIKTYTSSRSTFLTIYQCNKYDVWFSGFLYLLSCALRFVGPFVLGELVSFVSLTQLHMPTSISLGDAYGLAFALAGSQILSTLLHTWSDAISLRIGMRARNALMVVAFNQSLSLSNAAKSSTGTILNLVSNDSPFVVDFTRFFHQSWTAPLILIAGIAYIQILLGASVWSGLSLLFLFVPISYWMGKLQARIQRSLMKQTDLRIKIVNETLQGIKVVKTQAWEASFETLMKDARENELSHLLMLEKVRAVMTPLSVALPNAACVVAILTFVAIGGTLNAAKVFQVVSLFVVLRTPFVTFPLAIAQYSRVSVVNDRFNTFLALPTRTPLPQVAVNKGELTIEDASFEWETSSFQLSDVNLHVSNGEFICIIGTVGSGKSSLCRALLNDMSVLKGKVGIGGTVAFCSQEPFILNATLRDNVLFGKPYDEAKYRAVLASTTLDVDVDILPNKDLCEIGEKGINLSGGQKARVSLARAAYADADVLIMDDPLSAVDVHVAAHIFEHCFLGDGLRNKTRILVTNNLFCLSRVDRVVVMDHGHVEQIGPWNELNKARLVNAIDLVGDEQQQQQVNTTVEKPAPLLAQRSEPAMEQIPVAKINMLSSTTRFRSSKRLNLKNSKSSGKLIEAERKATGVIAGRVYSTYWLSGACGSWFAVTSLILLFGITEALFLSIDSFLALATQQNQQQQQQQQAMTSAGNSNTTITQQQQPQSFSQTFFFGWYGGLTLTYICTLLVRSLLFAYFHVQSARTVYYKLANKVLRFPMDFYWREPLGRIINRLSSDTNIIDVLLGQSWAWLIMCMARVIGILILISAVTPLFAVVLIPLGIIYFLLREFYRRTSRELQRLEGIARSPVYNHLGETLNGTTTLRAYARVQEWLGIAGERVDDNSRIKFALEMCSIWLTMVLESLGGMLILAAALVVVASRDILGPGLAGLALSFALNIVVNLNFSVKQATLVETQMAALERVLDFADLPIESGLEIGHVITPQDQWPTIGRVVFEDVMLTYRSDLDPALENISFVLEGGKRVGAVGRTGAGKSSIAVALFRLVDITAGRITIDGIDIAKLSKRYLRSRLTIIQQDPVCFRASVRKNLDPFDVWSDVAVWQALEHAHVADVIRSKAEGLDYQLTENGGNLSVGERALVCLARGILRKSKVVVLDEASAPLDGESDRKVQETIRTRFEGATMIVIAHRLETVVDLDLVMVVSDGQIVEMGIPRELMDKEDGEFAGLMKRSRSERGDEV